jgi:hypothetical protein
VMCLRLSQSPQHGAGAERTYAAKELFSGGAHSGFFYRQETHKIWFAFI